MAASSTYSSLGGLDKDSLVEPLPTDALAQSWGWRRVRYNGVDGYLPGYMLR